MSKERELLKQVVENFGYVQDIHLIVAIQKLLNQPKREPLSEEAVGELLMGGFSTHLMDLVRAIEQRHGIGVDDETV